MSDSAIPPYLSPEWQSIRIRLHAAAAHCSGAATESTSEAVRTQVNLAFAELRDVLFALSMMERGQPPHQHEEWQLQESAQGGMYCTACGKGVPTP